MLKASIETDTNDLYNILESDLTALFGKDEGFQVHMRIVHAVIGFYSKEIGNLEFVIPHKEFLERYVMISTVIFGKTAKI